MRLFLLHVKHLLYKAQSQQFQYGLLSQAATFQAIKKEKSLNKLNYWYMEILKWNASMPLFFIIDLAGPLFTFE